jgi:hypothetical protein
MNNDISPENEDAERQPRPIPEEWGLRCVNCGYDLTGLVERRCPECGEPFDVIPTLRANERSTWAYILANRCSPISYPLFLLLRRFGVPVPTLEWLLRSGDIVYYTVLAVMGLTLALLVLVQTFALFALGLLATGEVLLAALGRGRPWIRLILWTVCLGLALIMWAA